VEEFGTCYCGLYVRKDVFEGKASLVSIPERRPQEKQMRAHVMSVETPSPMPSSTAGITAKPVKSELKLWYCKQCGYVVFREEPSYICPICKAKREFFAEIQIGVYASS